MILTDTSAWVEYDRATGSPVHRRLAELCAVEGPLVTSEPVIMEVLAGVRDDLSIERPAMWPTSLDGNGCRHGV